MSASYVPRSAALNNAIEKFHHAFVDMLVGNTDGRRFVNKADMFKALQAAVRILFHCMHRGTDHIVDFQHLVNSELATCDAETPTYDPLLEELKSMKPLYDHPSGNVPANEFLRLARQFIPPSIVRKLDAPPKSDIELITGGTTKPPGTGKDSTTKPTTKPTTTKPTTKTTKPANSKPPATTKPATKPDVNSKQTMTTNGTKQTTTTNGSGSTKPAKSNPIVKRADDSPVQKIQPRPIKKKAVTYVEVEESDVSTGEEEEGEEEEESGQEEDEVEEVEVPVAKPARKKVVKSAAMITDEMEEDAAGGGEKIQWSREDRVQADKDAAWSGVDHRDPCLVENKDLRYGPLYWGSYNTPLAEEGPIAKEDLPNRLINPVDKDGHAAYMLADVYDTPCVQCVGSKTPPKACVSAGSKPNPLGATIAEEKERASACACCRYNKRRCQDHSRSRSRQIVANPFHDANSVVKGGSGKAKVKQERKVTPAAKTRAARKPAADNDLPDGEPFFHCLMVTLSSC